MLNDILITVLLAITFRIHCSLNYGDLFFWLGRWSGRCK